MRRVLIVGRTRYRLPLEPGLARKFDALRAVVDLRVIGSAPAGSPTGDATFRLVPPLRPRALDGLAFHGALAVPRRARGARVRPGRGARAGRARGGGLPRRAAARAEPHPDRARRPRRLALGDAPLRLAGAQAAQPTRRPDRGLGGAPRRRDPHGVRLHDGPRARGRTRAGGGLPRLHGSRAISRPDSAAAGAPSGAVHRRARALQEHRRAGGGMAAGGAPAARRAAPHRRPRHARGGRRGARP